MKQHREEELTLEILQAVDERSDMTQRHLADRMGIALGLANSYMRRCVRKGLIKITQAPANRYLYYLTPKGFSEKSRLTAEYLASSFDYYNRAGRSIAAAFGEIEAAGHGRIIFVGCSELAEIASVRAYDFELQILGTFDRTHRAPRFIGRPVWRDVADIPPFDAALYTAMSPVGDVNIDFVTSLDGQRFFFPDIVPAPHATTGP